jgi:hypothetical protein
MDIDPMVAKKNTTAAATAKAPPSTGFPADLFPPGVMFTATGLILPKNLSESDWIETGRTFGRIGEARQWAIGDWWVYGEGHKYGSRTATVNTDDWDGPTFDTCINYGSVCRAFKTPRRRGVLTFTHHAEVMGLTPAQQNKLLNWCAEPIAETGKPRSTRALREEIARQYPKPEPEGRAVTLRVAHSDGGVVVVPVHAKVTGGGIVEVPTQAIIREAPPLDPVPPDAIDATSLDVTAALDLIDQAHKAFLASLMPHSALRRTVENAQVALGVLREALAKDRAA